MVNAIIADDNKDFCMALANELNVTKDIKVIEMMSDGNRIIQEIKKLNPEILILDLKMPGKNGLQIIEEIENESIETNVIVVSGETSYIEKLRQSKKVVGYLQKGMGFKQICLEIEEKAKELDEKSMDQQILEYLFDLGFTSSNRGTFLIRDCIRYFLLTNKYDCNVKDLFKMVANKNVVASYTVKNNVHTSTKVAWKSGNQNYIIEKMKLADKEELSPKKVITMSKYYINID